MTVQGFLKYLLAFAIVLAPFFGQAQYVQLGSGNTSNAINECSPVNIWYRRNTSQFVYTAAELTAAGAPAGGGNISQMGFIITGLPIYDLPSFQIRFKHTTASNVSSDLGTTGWVTVRNPATYAPAIGGYDMYVLDVPFNWDGVSNLGVEVCFGQVSPTYDLSGQLKVYAATSGFRYRRTDAAGACYTALSFTRNWKPQCQLVFADETTWLGIVDDNWFDEGNWSAGVPTTEMSANIPSGTPANPVIDADGAVCNNLSISTDASLTLSGSRAIDVYGDWSNSGSFTPNQGEVRFRGSDPMTLATFGGNQDFYDLEVNGGGGLTITNGTYNITHQLQVTLGNFATNDAVTFTSNASGTSRIDEVPGYCAYTLVMNDSWPDGWNGGYVTLVVDGVAVGDYLCTDASTTVTLPVTNGSSFELVYTAGSYENENSYTLNDPNGNPLFSDGPTPTTGTVYSGTGNCGFTNPISGNVTTERYINAGATYWRNYCSPVGGATYSMYNDDFITSGYLGSTFPNWPTAAAPFNSTQWYDETNTGDIDQGYTAPTTAASTIPVGRGYISWCGDNAAGTGSFVYDLTGTATAGPVTLPVSYTTSSFGNLHDGWNLVANPYMSSIDWTKGAGTAWDKTNLEDAVYVMDPDLGTYASWISGASSNGGSPIIASSQSFWVKANAASPALVVYESAKSPLDQGYFKAASANSPGMSIKLNILGGRTDEMVVRTLPGATEYFDADYDARKLLSDHGLTPNIMGVDLDSTPSAILSLEIPTQDKVIPLDILVRDSLVGANTTSYELRFDRRHEIVASCMLLHDLETGTYIDLLSDSTYSFTNTGGSALQSRFELLIGADLASTMQVSDISCNGDADGAIQVSGFGAGPWDYTWEDANGNVLLSDPQQTGSSMLDDLTAGTYIVTVTNNGSMCPVRTAEITVTEPDPIVIAGTSNSEAIGWDGEVLINVTGGTPPYLFNWDNGDQSQNLQGVEGGMYTVTVTDAHGCESDATFTVNSTVSIEENSNDLLVEVFPNPNNGDFFIKLEQLDNSPATIQVLDLQGQIIYNEQLAGGQNGTLTSLHLPETAQGMYFLVIHSDQGQFKGKINVVR